MAITGLARLGPHWFLGTSDAFYCTQVGVPGCTAPYPSGIPYRGYTTWNVGIGITKSVFTLVPF